MNSGLLDQGTPPRSQAWELGEMNPYGLFSLKKGFWQYFKSTAIKTLSHAGIVETSLTTKGDQWTKKKFIECVLYT